MIVDLHLQVQQGESVNVEGLVLALRIVQGHIRLLLPVRHQVLVQLVLLLGWGWIVLHYTLFERVMYDALVKRVMHGTFIKRVMVVHHGLIH